MTAILFRGARLVDGLADTARETTDVLVIDDRIAAIAGPADGPIARPDLPDLRVIELAGHTLMPGLIDAHVHASAAVVMEDVARPMPASLRAQHARIELEAMLRRGFTTARDAGGADAGLRMAVEQGLIDGPRLLVSGKALSQTGGHGDDRAVVDGDPVPGAWPGDFARIADGIDEVRLAARQELRRGADQIKICASGGVMSETDPIDMLQYSEGEISAIVEEAASRGTYVLAHAYGGPAIARAVRCGVRSIEHANLVDVAAADEVAAHGAWVVPTLVTYDTLARDGAAQGMDPRRLAKVDVVREAGLRSFDILRRAGAKVGFGTDLLGPHRVLQPHEFRIRAEAERPADIVRSATSVNADLIGRPDLGRVAVGATADLIVVDGDPLADIGVLASPAESLRLVMTGGRIRVDALPS
ncbi:MAG TPA: amidohydrolase family protein [Candidatus Limnocylindrales bacterium]|nr:amidohydrolase family protein [Candidatus Limnocylindrales bacterium]